MLKLVLIIVTTLYNYAEIEVREQQVQQLSNTYSSKSSTVEMRYSSKSSKEVIPYIFPELPNPLDKYVIPPMPPITPPKVTEVNP